MIKVEKSDLIRELAGVPLEVARLMMVRQVEQGNEPDITVFQEDLCACVDDGGFDWNGTPEWDINQAFWGRICRGREFSVFYELYPRRVAGDLTCQEWS
jgi:hypothetical protein